MSHIHALTGVLLLCACTSLTAAEHKGIHLQDHYLEVPFASAGENDAIYNHINPSRGTIEFWIKPDFDWLDKGTHHLFFWGRRDNAKSIFVSTISGRIYFFLCGAKRIGAAVRLSRNAYGLQPGTWHHLACCWDLTDGKTHRRVFLDGKCVDSKEFDDKPDREFGGIAKIPVSMYVGTGKANARLVTEVSPQASFSQFRISDIVRYEEAFTPEPGFTVDAHTLVYVPFTDGSITGMYYRPEMKPGTVEATRIGTEKQGGAAPQ